MLDSMTMLADEAKDDVDGMTRPNTQYLFLLAYIISNFPCLNNKHIYSLRHLS